RGGGPRPGARAAARVPGAGAGRGLADGRRRRRARRVAGVLRRARRPVRGVPARKSVIRLTASPPFRVWAVPPCPRQQDIRTGASVEYLTVTGARENNLRDVSVR